MTVTIPVGTWLIPMAITLAAIVAYARWARAQPSSGGRNDYGAGAILSFGGFLVALVVSLAAWLAWAVARIVFG